RPEDAVLRTSSGGSDMEDVDLDIQNNLNSPHREKSGRKYDPASTSSDRSVKVDLWKTMKAAVSSQTLRRLRRAILTSGVVLIHDIAHPHNAVVTQQLLEQFKWDFSDHRRIAPT
ncbi:hypothetical protein AVEN_20052-1, partial [Araneus ventricosus]